MANVSFKAESTTLILNDEVIQDFINGDIIELAPVNPTTSRTYGANRAVNIQHRSDREVHTLKFRVMRNSDSDIWLNEQKNQDKPVVFNGSVKEIFIKDGEELVESFELQSGSYTDGTTFTKNNVDGNNEVEYTIECYARRLV